MKDHGRADYSLVPTGSELRKVPNIRGWLLQRPDIVSGKHAYAQDNSPVKTNGQEIIRDTYREREAILDYFSWMNDAFPDYARLLHKIQATSSVTAPQKGEAGVTEIGKCQISPMDENCRVAVVIPAKDEEACIFRTLQTITNQRNRDGSPLDPRLFDVTVLVNTSKSEQHDKTYDEVMRFKQAFPELKVNVVQIKVDNRWRRVGFIRKLATDLTLMRSLARKNYQNPLYIQSEDADLLTTDPDQMAKTMDMLDQQPWLDAVSGHTEMETDNDLVLLKRRWEDFMRTISRRLVHKIPPEKRNFWSTRIWTFGTNTVFSAETYALAGGYNWEATTGEDLDLGHRISLLRGTYDQQNRFIPNIATVAYSKTRSVSSPRRALWEMIKNTNGYAEANFQNADVRKISLTELEAKAPYRRLTNDSDSQGRVRKLLYHQYEQLRFILPNQQLAERTMRKCMIFLGFKTEDFRINNNQVIINNLENVIQALERRRQRIKSEAPDAREKLTTEQRYLKDRQQREALSAQLQQEGASLSTILAAFGNDYSVLEKQFREKTGLELVKDPINSLAKEVPLTKKATVVIPVYDNQDQLTKSLAALNCASFARKYPGQFEVIVVDDGSTKGDILKAVKAAGDLDINLRVVTQQNSGKVGALYTAAQLATGDVVIAIDPDFLPYPQAIEEMMKRYEVVGNMALVGFRREIDPADPQIQVENMPAALSKAPNRFVDDVRFIGDNNFHETKWFKTSGHDGAVFDGHWHMRMSSFTHEVFRAVPKQEMIRAMAGYTPGVTMNPGDEILLHRLIAQGLYVVPAPSAVGYHLSHESHHNPQRSQERRDLMRRLAEEPLPRQSETPNPYLAKADVIYQQQATPETKTPLPASRMRNADAAILYAQAGLYDQSIAYMQQALQIDASSPRLNALYAVALIRKNNIQKAAAWVDRARQHSTTHGFVLYAEGLLAIKQGNYQLAQEKMAQAIASGDELAQEFAGAYIREKRIDFIKEATLYLEEAKLQPQRREKAILALEAALMQNPNDTKARQMLTSLAVK